MAVFSLDSVDQITVEIISQVYETEPVGGPPQGDYLNGVVGIETTLAPMELLSVLKKIETDLGRVKNVKNGPRVIDLDILVYDDISMATEELTIPHPGIEEREFVLKGLREIAPHLDVCSRVLEHV